VPAKRERLGWEHQKRRAALAPPTGQPCPCFGCARHPGAYCRAPMWPSNSDADHLTPRALGGNDSPLRWLCRSCNRSRGATLGNLLRTGRTPTQAPRATRRWMSTPFRL
jgi:5-methylcytosine-specific restriction endonuclease McrA